jgi:hypothetical protein
MMNFCGSSAKMKMVVVLVTQSSGELYVQHFGGGVWFMLCTFDRC